MLDFLGFFRMGGFHTNVSKTTPKALVFLSISACLFIDEFLIRCPAPVHDEQYRNADALSITIAGTASNYSGIVFALR